MAKKKVMTSKEFREFKKLNPKSVVREGEVLTAGNSGKAGRKKKKDPTSVVREGERKPRKKKKDPTSVVREGEKRKGKGKYD